MNYCAVYNTLEEEARLNISTLIVKNHALGSAIEKYQKKKKREKNNVFLLI
jgi:hypothetical protein